MDKTTIFLVASVMAVVTAEPPSQYGPPSGFGSFASPSSQFGAPGADRLSAGSGGYAGANGFNGEEGSEPANYEFKYDVEDQEYGVKFGHEENRQGDVAMGAYYVLLPDGRIQHVEYVADQEGYKPMITYEDSQEGYARGGPGGAGGGYSQDSPNGGFGSHGGHSQGGYQFKK